MTDKPWYTLIDAIAPHVVHISTPRGSGTGFLLFHAKSAGLTAIATAAHVIDQAHYWEEPIRLSLAKNEGSVLLKEADRSIYLHADDTAAIVIKSKDLKLPDKPLPLLELGKTLKVGNDIGWLGFPAMANSTLCFFGGRVSAWLNDQKAYLVDGVAINGVSGGPAFYTRVADGEVAVMGVVSAYVPNRSTGEALPGLAMLRSVSRLHDDVKNLRSFDDAKSQETSQPPVQPAQSPSSAPAMPMKRKAVKP